MVLITQWWRTDDRDYGDWIYTHSEVVLKDVKDSTVRQDISRGFKQVCLPDDFAQTA